MESDCLVHNLNSDHWPHAPALAAVALLFVGYSIGCHSSSSVLTTSTNKDIMVITADSVYNRVLSMSSIRRKKPSGRVSSESTIKIDVSFASRPDILTFSSGTVLVSGLARAAD